MRWLDPHTTIAFDPDGRPVLCALTKRTYEVSADGRLRPAEQQWPLDTSAHAPPPGTFDDTWKAELDAAPFKVGTDIVVFGRAHAPRAGCRQMVIELGVPERGLRVQMTVTGDRRCEYRASRDPLVSPPEPFEAMAIGYDRAYGGIDPHVEPPHEPRDIEESLSLLLRPPGIYPRNPAGVGYVVHNHQDLVDGLRLPNVERPGQELRADQILVKDPRHWWRQPMPAGLGWFDVGWFPRCVHASALPLFPAPDEVAEVKLGLLPPDFNRRFLTPDGQAPRLDHRLFSGASPGLTLPFLRGDESILTTGLCPQGAFNLQLPGDRPKAQILHQGRSLAAQVVPHTVAVLPAERRVFVVWRASALVSDPALLDALDPSIDPASTFQVILS